MRQEDESSLYYQEFEECIRDEGTGPTQSFFFHLMLYSSL